MVQTINLERSKLVRSRLITVEELNQFVVQIDEWIADYIKRGRELSPTPQGNQVPPSRLAWARQRR